MVWLAAGLMLYLGAMSVLVLGLCKVSARADDRAEERCRREVKD